MEPASRLDHNRVVRLINGVFPSNTYIYPVNDGTSVNGCIVIDPGLDFDLIEEVLQSANLRPLGIFCTHGHFDHVGSAQLLKEKYGAKIFLHLDDAKVAKAANFTLMVCKIAHRIKTPVIDSFINETSEIIVGDLTVKFIHTPGHTQGSCLLNIGDALFTGDTLYKNGVGLVDFPGEDKDQLRASLERVWDTLPETWRVYPGHGESDFFGRIKQFNGPLRGFMGLSGVPSAATVRGCQ